MPFTKTIPIRRPSTTSRNTGPGKIRKSAVRSSICPGLPEPSGKTYRFSSPAAGHRRRPSTRCAGRQRESWVSISAKRACAVPRSSNENTNWTIFRCASFPSSGRANWRRASTRSSAPECSIICRIPMQGLGALRDVLEPDGAMHVMVYAPYGRTGIYMLQDFCKRIGIGATDVEIRDLIETLKALPPGHPLRTPAARRPGLPERGGARRRASAPMRSRVFGSAAARLSRARGSELRSMGSTGGLQPATAACWRTSARPRDCKRCPRRISMPPANSSGARCFATARLLIATTPPTI